MNAVITGATKGIGKAITDLLAGKGFNVAICSRNKAELTHYHKELSAQHPDIKVISKATDMSVKEEVMALAAYINTEMEHVDVLVNNAGLFIPGATLSEADGMLEKMINTNVYSAYHLTRALAPAMQSYGAGHIFNMCSIASQIAYPNGGSYSISKFALLGYTKVLREELKESNIKVTAILPGATWSASWAGVDLPRARLMEAQDIALAVWNALQMSPSAVVEEIVIRPQLGDL